MKLFENQNYDNLILPKDEFRLFSDTSGEFPLHEKEMCKEICDEADRALAKEIPQLYAHVYMRFLTPGDGNRSEFEEPFFARRRMLYKLLLGELASNFSGKYMEKITDLVWLIMEESTWIVNAHVGSPLPVVYDEAKHCYVDLFCAETASILSIVYYFLHDKFNPLVANIVNERLIYRIKTRVLDPFLEYSDMWWMGFVREDVNNWCPWIISNVLTACAITESDIECRRKITAKSLLCLDNFVKGYVDDGGCDEGPGYWGAASGALFMALEILYDITGGRVNKFTDPLFCKMIDYIRKVNLAGDYYTCFADAHVRLGGDNILFYRMAVKTNNEKLYGFAISRMLNPDGTFVARHRSTDTLFMFPRSLCSYFYPYPTVVKDYCPEKTEALENIQVAVLRSEKKENCLFTAAIKGGHNNESHNHNDIGSFVVYRNMEPFAIDIGAPTYTKALFDHRRYTLFGLRSCDHNLPVINGKAQIFGADRKADSFIVNQEESSVEVSYKNAYENRDEIKKCVRKMTVEENRVVINEHIELEKEGEVYFNIFLCKKPCKVENGVAEFDDGAKISAVNSAVECVDVVLDDEHHRKDWRTDRLYKLVITPQKGVTFDTTVIFE